MYKYNNSMVIIVEMQISRDRTVAQRERGGNRENSVRPVSINCFHSILTMSRLLVL